MVTVHQVILFGFPVPVPTHCLKFSVFSKLTTNDPENNNTHREFQEHNVCVDILQLSLRKRLQQSNKIST